MDRRDRHYEGMDPMIKSTISAAAESGKNPATPPATSLEVTSVPDSVRILRQQAQEKFGELAHNIVEAFPATVLTAVSGAMFGGAANAGGFKAHLDNILAASGNPTDPNEIMMAQQLVWSHHHVGNLVSKAALATTLQEVEVYNQALARVMAEFRRSSLALREYRSGPSPKQITVVKQQNVAAGNQNVAMVDGQPAENPSDIELDTTHARLNHVEFTDSPFATADRRTLEPVEAKRRDS
jgi:hypothetical protein